MKISLHPESEDPALQKAFQTEQVSFKELTFQKKILYIWDYYKWWFIIAAFLIVSAVILVPQILENKKDCVLYALFVNTQITDQTTTSLMDDFVEYADIDLEGKRITLDPSLKINLKSADTLSMNSSQKMVALLGNKTMDLVIEDEDCYRHYASLGVFINLEEELPAELLEKCRPYLVYTSGSEDGGNEKAYGINLKDCKILQKENAYVVEPYFSICVNAKEKENAIKFLEYLFSDM